MEDVVALPEGRQGDRELVQAIVDILAEPAGPHLALERHIGGGDEPHLHRDRLRASERLHLSHLQRTQQLRLGGERKIDDFIEEQRAAPGQLELPLLPLMRHGERTLLVAEQLRLDQRVRDRTAVDGDERLVAASAQMMDRAGHELLAGAGFALDEDRERRVSHLLDLLGDLLHLPTRPHQPAQRTLADLFSPPQSLRALLDDGLELAEMTLQRELLFLDPATRLARRQRPVQRGDEVLPVDRLVDEVASPAPEAAPSPAVPPGPPDPPR